MSDVAHFVTVGTSPELIANLWDPVALGATFRFSHIMHPQLHRPPGTGAPGGSSKHYFAENPNTCMPPADRKLLASLECEGVPTIHNMIVGDRVVSQLLYEDALRYTTFIANRLMELFASLRPAAIIGGFDAVHGSMGLAVARRLRIPWFALHFSAIPSGYACFCDQLSPNSRVYLEPTQAASQSFAARVIQQFESREISAPAYIAPVSKSTGERLAKLLSRTSTAFRMLRGDGDRSSLSKFTKPRSQYRIANALRFLRRSVRARNAVEKYAVINAPPSNPFILFGLHMQPESSIDVWAPFYSNQMWVIELLARSIPPSHALLVKVHKSDTSRHSASMLRKMLSLPGVELIAPAADARQFIERADLVVQIQGTIGLEAALMGKSVIMLGQSAFSLLPSVTQAGATTDLPALVRRKLTEARPSSSDILTGYVEYLRPFAPASENDWTRKRTESEISNYRVLFERLRGHVLSKQATP